jgi:hypothetical protein
MQPNLITQHGIAPVQAPHPAEAGQHDALLTGQGKELRQALVDWQQAVGRAQSRHGTGV